MQKKPNQTNEITSVQKDTAPAPHAISAAQRLRPLLKKPAVLLLLAVELLVVLTYLVGALRTPASYSFAVGEWEEIATASTITLDETTGLRGVTEMTEGEDLLQTPAMTLPAGHYNITLDYFYQPSRMADNTLSHANLHFTAKNEGVITGENALLDHTKTHATVSLNVRQTDSTIRLVARNDSGIFQVGAVTITQDRLYAASCALAALLGCLLLNALALLLLPASPVRLRGNRPGYLLALTAVALLASVPLFQDGGGLTGADWTFHLSRVEGIANALREGQFPVRVYSLAKNGYGYAPSLFYGELFLYFPAVLRLFGVSLQGAYHAFAVAVQLGTAYITFYSLRQLLKNNSAALLGSVLYLLSPYRLTNFYMRAAVGEYLAMMLLPLIPAALALLYAETPTRRQRVLACAQLVIAFGGLVQCHVITLELAALATGAFCLWQWRKTFTKQRLAVWGAAVVLVVLLNLWFLLPFATVMVGGQYGNVYTSDPYRVQQMGLSLPDLLLWQPDNITLGLALILGALIFAYAAFAAGARLPARLGKIGWSALVFGGVAAAMSTTSFPWSLIGQLPVVGPLLIAIQFPWRYLTLAALLLAVSAACGILALQETGQPGWARAAAGLCVAVALCGTGNFFGQYLENSATHYVGSSATLQYATGKISNTTYYFDALYLPAGAMEDLDGVYPTQTVSNVTVEAITQDGGVTTATVTATPTDGGHLELPLLYYPGYKVVAGEGAVFQTVNGQVGVVLPAGFTGTVQVAFREPLRWLLADAVSLLTVLALLAAAVYLPRRPRRPRRP